MKRGEKVEISLRQIAICPNNAGPEKVSIVGIDVDGEAYWYVHHALDDTYGWAPLSMKVVGWVK